MNKGTYRRVLERLGAAGVLNPYHTTVNGYVQNVRMHKAVELLKNSDVPITQIAREVGYYGDGYFQTAFKKYYGVSPGELRRELRGRNTVASLR